MLTVLTVLATAAIVTTAVVAYASVVVAARADRQYEEAAVQRRLRQIRES